MEKNKINNNLTGNKFEQCHSKTLDGLDLSFRWFERQ